METQSDSSPAVPLRVLQPAGPITGILRGNEAPIPRPFESRNIFNRSPVSLPSVTARCFRVLPVPVDLSVSSKRDQVSTHPCLPSESPRDTARPSCGFLSRRRDLRCILLGPRPFLEPTSRNKLEPTLSLTSSRNALLLLAGPPVASSRGRGGRA